MFSSLNKLDFIEACNLFNQAKWYEAHDSLEEIWMELDGDEKQIIQGILQIAVSQLHLERGNKNGAIILLGEGLGRLNKRKYLDYEFDIICLCETSNIILKSLQKGENIKSLDQPKIIFK
tara:strand:- start:9881 stop:10240 length:360 start_codon:yes stop_codon:yes gene_type:complete